MPWLAFPEKLIIMNNFKQRSLTGIGLVVLITTTLLLGQYAFIALMLVVNLLSLTEFYRLLGFSQKGLL